MAREKNPKKLPDIGAIEEALKWEKKRRHRNRALRSTAYAVLTIVAVAVLVANLILPVLQIYGTSMTPTLYDGNIVVTLKRADFKRQDIIAFYYNNRVLVKRVIALSGEWVDIDEDGNVTVNGEPLDEPYVSEKALGDCDIELPYQVPDERIFVMGDHRAVSVDSRSHSIGCVSKDQIVGKLLFRIWPFDKIGSIQ